MLNNIIEQISIFENVTLVLLKNIGSDVLSQADIFTSFAKFGVNVDMISQTPETGGDISISFTVSDYNLDGVMKALAAIKKSSGAENIITEINAGNIKVNFSGHTMSKRTGVAAKVFSVFDKCGAKIKLITTSENSISCLTDKLYEADVVSEIQKYWGSELEYSEIDWNIKIL